MDRHQGQGGDACQQGIKIEKIEGAACIFELLVERHALKHIAQYDAQTQSQQNARCAIRNVPHFTPPSHFLEMAIPPSFDGFPIFNFPFSIIHYENSISNPFSDLWNYGNIRNQTS